MRVVFRGRLPSRNEEIAANRSHWAAGAKVKAYAQTSLGWAIRAAISAGELERVERPVEVYVEWHDAPRHRDVDNIQSSTKYILDALVEQGVLPNDNQKWVKQVWQKVVPDEDDYVVVELSYDPYTLGKNAVPVVRCKDCKHKPSGTGEDIEFPDEICPCQCEDFWYSWIPQDDFFCAWGERREG